MESIVTLSSVLLLGQVEAAEAAGAASEQALTVWNLALKGGPLMIPIGICSLVALAVIVERLVSLRPRQVIPPGFARGLQPILESSKRNGTAALDYCSSNGSPIANIFAAGLKRMHEPLELLEKHIQEAGQREVHKLRKHLRLLALIASISPLLGLLGTIFGMIKAFQTVALAGNALGKAELLATGIYQAMITTAAGLMVAIPALIGYHWISARIEQLVAEMDQVTCDFVEQHASPGPDTTEEASRFRPVRNAGQDEEADEPEIASSTA